MNCFLSLFVKEIVRYDILHFPNYHEILRVFRRFFIIFIHFVFDPSQYGV